jgi:hypothetical protein
MSGGKRKHRYSSICGFLPPNQNLSMRCGWFFAGSWGGTSGSAASQPGMVFLWSTLNATGVLALLNHMCVVNMDV